ncbi:hypothetical protein [Desulfotomaculum nigrificans]|uniref:hypothetical protein n=1 Tax=Desulfotomaculum nigrificans TaxID=1565 RepID=UPI0001FAF0E8|nr:hypothetical protein [Desulfotomaculum nigrificans]
MMKSWKTKAVSTLLALSVMLPTAAFAADVANGTGEVTVNQGFVHHQHFNQEKQQKFNDKLLELVSKYTPESLTAWKDALAKQQELMQQFKDKHPVDQQRPTLSAETKAKVKAIFDDLKNGKLTREQAQEQLKSLGIELKDKHKDGFKGQSQLSDADKEKLKQKQNSLMGQFREAVKANDETKIRELLPQMLEQLKEKNQDMSNKLAESSK